MEQQDNSGFLQSPEHQQKKPALSELETSFSDQREKSPDKTAVESPNGSANPAAVGFNGLQLPPQANVAAPQQPGVTAGSPGSVSSMASGQTPPISYTNGNINLPWQYYQYLQQMAMMNPAIVAMSNGGPPQNVPYLQPQQTQSAQATPQDAQPSVASMNTNYLLKPQMPTNSARANSQIYEEISNHKMYGDVPKLPAPRQQQLTNQERSDDSTDSLLQSTDCRKKINPLYGDNGVVESGGVSPSEPSSSEPFSTHYSTSKESKCSRCICGGFLLLTIITCTALAITLLTATGVISLQKVPLPETTIKPVTAAASVDVSSNITNMISSYQQVADNQTETLYKRLELLEIQLKNLSESQQKQEDELLALTDRFPTNALDGAHCIHNFSKYPLKHSVIDTGLVPDSTSINKGYVVVGVTCTSNNYTNSRLHTEVNQEGNTQYKCICSEPIPDSTDNWCTIDYWMCPTIT